MWCELVTNDVAQATRFYGALFGWHVHLSPINGYAVVTAGERGIGGMSVTTDRPRWVPYVSVADVDAITEVAARAGGRVIRAPGEVAGFGRAACIEDPHGAALFAWRGFHGDGPRAASARHGDPVWYELWTPDAPAARRFYGEVLGWSDEPLGGGEVRAFTAGGHRVAAVVATPDEARAQLVTYVQVDDLSATRARVLELGGRVLVERRGAGAHAIGVVADDAGAVFGLFEAH